MQADGKIIAGGYGAPKVSHDKILSNPGVFRLKANGSLDVTFHGAKLGASFAVYGFGVAAALAVQADDKIIVGGTFETVGGVTCPNLARLNANGTLDKNFEVFGKGANGTVRSIVFQQDGKIVLGGSFTKVNGVARAGVARLDADGSVDRTFDPGTGTEGTGAVNSVSITPGGDILIGGTFTRFDGEDRDGVALLAGGISP